MKLFNDKKWYKDYKSAKALFNRIDNDLVNRFVSSDWLHGKRQTLEETYCMGETNRDKLNDLLDFALKYIGKF